MACSRTLIPSSAARRRSQSGGWATRPQAARILHGAALGDPDPFVAWSIRRAIRTLNNWNVDTLTASLLDTKTQDDALKLCDEAWAPAVVEALDRAIPKMEPEETRAVGVSTLAGLYRKYPKWNGRWFGTNPLAGRFPQKTEAWNKDAMARVQEGLSVALKDSSPAVRLNAIAGLIVVGRPAATMLRAAMATEKNPGNVSAIARGLGVLGDFGSAPALGAIVQDAKRPELLRVAALEALGELRGPQALTARISAVYDPNAPASLVALALPSLGRDGIIPPNDLAGFLDNADPSIRAAALRALTSKKPLPNDVRLGVLARLGDSQATVRKAAVEAVVAMGMREAIPAFIASALSEKTRPEAVDALCAMPDARALPVYLSALGDKSLDVRNAAESALLSIRDTVRPDLEAAARKGKLEGPAALAMERVLTRFTPVVDWKVIGPFARTTPRVFVGEASIDFARSHTGAEGRTITWVPRKGDPLTGRVVIDDFKAGAGDRGGFGYDTNGSPNLCSFAYAEVASDRDRDALLLVGSSGTVKVTVNETMNFDHPDDAGRAYRPDSDLVRVVLKKGKNRILVVTRQGIGAWSFSVQVSEPSTIALAGLSKGTNPEALRSFAMSHEGDTRRGEQLFFDEKGIGCVKCHAVSGRGASTVGPDLAGLSLKYDKAELIRSVLEPSNRIATGYQPVLLVTKDGKVRNGLLKAETDASIELVDAEAKVTRVSKGDIDDRKIGDVSIMPAGLVDSLSVVEFSDLISYLQGPQDSRRRPFALALAAMRFMPLSRSNARRTACNPPEYRSRRSAPRQSRRRSDTPARAHGAVRASRRFRAGKGGGCRASAGSRDGRRRDPGARTRVNDRPRGGHRGGTGSGSSRNRAPAPRASRRP